MVFTQSLSLLPMQIQALSMQQYLSMQTSMLMGIPIPAFDRVIGDIVANPERYDGKNIADVVQEAKQNKVQSFFPYLTTRNQEAIASGIIVNLDLVLASPEVKELAREVCIDGVYITRKDGESDKPEFVPAEHLKERGQGQLNIQVLGNFKNALQLYNFLFKERNWIVSQLRRAYNNIGGAQREFIQSLDTRAVNIYSFEELADDMGFHSSTISRLINSRFVAIEHDERIYLFPSREFLLNKDEYKRNIVFPILNSVLADEFKQKVAFSDQELCDRIERRVARRTITKYRKDAGIPATSDRRDFYDTRVLEKPYETKTSLQRLVGVR